MAISSIWELAEFTPYRERFDERQRELLRRKSYYDGSVYRSIRQMLGWLGPRLYRGIKPLYLPLSRAVNVDAGIIPGGWALPEDEPGRDKWRAAIDTVFDWSDWDVDGVLYIHYGAMFGVSALKMADLREVKQVVIKPVSPACLYLVGTTMYSQAPATSIWVETRTGADGKRFEYAEIITSEVVRTFADGQPHAFDERPAEYPNDLGFVPFVEVDHIRTGEAMGEATYQMAIPLLDEVNEVASYLADIIKKHAEPQWAIDGAEPSDLTKSGDNIWFLPGGSKATPLVAGIDIPGVLEFVREIRDQVYGSLPELAFAELLEKTQIATATLELQLMELVLKIKRCRPNYDHGLADALRMAGRAAGSLGVKEIAILADEGLRFDPERPILPLDPETRIRIESAQIDLARKKEAAPAAGPEPVPQGGPAPKTTTNTGTTNGSNP